MKVLYEILLQLQRQCKRCLILLKFLLLVMILSYLIIQTIIKLISELNYDIQ